ncbi:sodium:solute symporter family transporter [Catalinimonas niigatensis]|uniref:sodium:solute symporter family transporter n=1 Tax=Catalinimonas niigatensis TaxID=1397264 RepID=UPI0026652C48|nr:hypothetical protein [Catalinimonas niigatensis]WPP49919.1 hypothetical protein PZB72_24945 [Catalinimonas niigatensis]
MNWQIEDAAVLIIYVLIIVFLSVKFKAKHWEEVFISRKKLQWWIAGASILMFWWNPANDMMMMGILIEEGYVGSWLVHNKLIAVGIAPIIFAPLWARLKFVSDNHFILFRFSGVGAKVLHQFRALYVGYVVVVFLSSFGIIGMSKMLITVFDLSYENSLLISFSILALYLLKNTFKQKVRTDILHAFIYLATLVITCMFIFNEFGGFGGILSDLKQNYENQIKLVPESTSFGEDGMLSTFLVFVLVQWWSTNVLDSSSPEAQRYMSTGNSREAFMAAFFPVIVGVFIMFFVSLIQDTLMLSYLKQDSMPDSESWYIEGTLSYLPSGFRMLALIAFMAGFITTIEAFINWGASFLVDYYRTYVKKVESVNYQKISYMSMYLILSSAILVVIFNDSLLSLQKLIFSISAGVGPVFVLRWFWWRVNAWAQLSAMFSSLFFALSFDLAYENSLVFQTFIDDISGMMSIGYFPLKLVVLTILVTFSWITVMYMTPADDTAILKRFVKQVQPGGIWPKHWQSGAVKLSKKLFLAILYAIINILPIFFIWEFKYGVWWKAVGLLTLFFILIVYILRRIKT